MRKIFGLIFTPLLFISVFSFAWTLVHVFHFSSPYISNLILLFAIFGTLETLFPLREVRFDSKEVFFGLFFTLLNPVFMPVIWYVLFYPLFQLKITLGGFIPSLSLPVQILVIFISTEFFRYWLHRLQHEIPWLWKFHAVHHCMPSYYAFNQYLSHPIDYFIRNVLSYTPLIIFDFSPTAMVMAQTLSVTGGMLSHTNFSLDNGIWNKVVATYQVHRWHHSYLPQEANTNYGVAILLWDHLFGTYFYPQDRVVDKIGIENKNYQYGNIRNLLLAPFKK